MTRPFFKKYLFLPALLPFFLLVLFYELLPLAMVVVRSFSDGAGGVTLQNFIEIFTKRLYFRAVTSSVWISLLSSLIGITLGFFGAKAACSASGRLRRFFTGILNMTSNFAGVPLAFSYIILLGNTGVLVMLGKAAGFAPLAEFSLYGFTGLLLTYIYFQVPLATLLLLPSFQGLRPEWRESVRLMGGGGLTYWLRVGVPNLLPSLLGTVSVLFANAIAAYATAYALLQNNFPLLPIRISEQFVGDVVQRKEFGSALAVVLMLLMVLASGVNLLILRGRKGGRSV